MLGAAIVAAYDEFVEFVVEMLQLFGAVTAKKMFGGYGLYKDGIMFALIADDALYFKADDVSRSDFIDKGLKPFIYTKNGTQYKMSYYGAPDDVFEDIEVMADWAEKAFSAALRANKEKYAH